MGRKLRKHKRLIASIIAGALALVLLLGMVLPFAFRF